MKSSETTVGIVYNAYVSIPGRAAERASEESIEQAAQEAYSAVSELGYRVHLLPLHDNIINLFYDAQRLKVDVFINLCEAFRGLPQLEANVAAFFELVGFPFTGNSCRTLALCQDKFKTKSILKSSGLPVPNGQLIHSSEQLLKLPLPVIVKPNNEDASIGVHPDSVIRNGGNPAKQIEKIIRIYNQPALVEEYIDGREFNVAILDGEKVEALPVSEIDFSKMSENSPRIVGYEAKWYENHTLFRRTPPICPAQIDETMREKLQQTALSAFAAVGGRDYARVDFRMNGGGEIFILEVNPNPDTSLSAGYPRALSAAGIEYRDFWQRMIENALRRKTRQ